MASCTVISNSARCQWKLKHSGLNTMKSWNLQFRMKLTFSVRCNVKDDNAQIQKLALHEATRAAALRFQESQRPEPLFHDPYAGCFIESDFYKGISSNIHCIMTSSLNHYCLAIRFIDDKLLGTVNRQDGPHQIVLLTDGMDTRPFRLKWPSMSMIFDISFEPVYQIASKKLKEVGAKTSRNTVFWHIPAELSELQKRLGSIGYRGDRSSIWAIQGLYPMTSDRFEEILYQVSCLAMKGSHFVGEIPLACVETDSGSEEHSGKWIERVFRCNGFSVEIFTCEEVARDLFKNVLNDDGWHVDNDGGESSVLFVAQQQRLSDDQEGFFSLSVALIGLMLVISLSQVAASMLFGMKSLVLHASNYLEDKSL